jgi:hypothetical protein
MKHVDQVGFYRNLTYIEMFIYVRHSETLREECKDTYKGPVCNCEHGYKRKHGHCVGTKITHKHTHTFIKIKHSTLASLISYFKNTQHIKFMIGHV